MDYEHYLPSEIWTLIFSFAKGKSVARIVPQVCKQFKKLSSTEELWKSKCRMENMDWSVKPASESFKIFYFSYRLSLFPLYGIEIGITTRKELIEYEGAVKDEEMEFVTIREVNFWFNGPNPVLHMMYLVRNLYKMPEEWIAKGINYSRSWYDYIIFMRRRFKNCQITQEPHQKAFMDKGNCFFATAQSILKHKNIYYGIVFTFGYNTGDERSSDTLYSISIRIGFSETETENYTKLYETNAITPADYVIPEDVLHAFEK
jgi:hypothetical protein